VLCSGPLMPRSTLPTAGMWKLVTLSIILTIPRPPGL
jgi:hypothetical protein